MATINSVQRDEYLTNLLIGYNGDGMTRIGDKLMPRFGVNLRRGYYFTADAEKEKFRIENNVIARRTATPEVTIELGKAPFGPLTKRGLKQFIDEEDVEAYGDLAAARAAATNNLAMKMMLAHEKEVADMLTNTSVITSYDTLTGNDQFSDFQNSNPVNVIDEALTDIKANSMKEANTVAMSWPVWVKVRRHPDLLGLLNVASLRMLSPEMFADIFGLKNVWIGDLQYNSAKKGQTASTGYVWGKHMLFAYISPTADSVIDDVTLGRTFYKKDSYFVDSYSEKDPDGEFVRTHDFYDVMTVVTSCAHLLRNVIA